MGTMVPSPAEQGGKGKMSYPEIIIPRSVAKVVPTGTQVLVTKQGRKFLELANGQKNVMISSQRHGEEPRFSLVTRNYLVGQYRLPGGEKIKNIPEGEFEIVHKNNVEG